jgi:Nif-specific regulatory protein
MATTAGLKLADSPPNRNASEIHRLATFLEISQTLAAASNHKAALQQVLTILSTRHSVCRVTLALLNAGGEIEVVASEGHTGERARAKFRLGEGITGRVVQSGKPIVVPQVSREPMFLRRTSDRPELAREEISYISVPVLLNRKAIGALGADFRFEASRDFERTVKFLGVVASLIAQAIRIQRAIETERDKLREENTHLRSELRERYDFSNILGTSGPMRLVYEQISQVARTDTTVLVRGESGTGKELIAQAIHYNSMRAKRPFVKVSCAALPETLIESELFGYEKGAFTGAEMPKKGRFELAEGARCSSTDRRLNLTTQIKLLRVLPSRGASGSARRSAPTSGSWRPPMDVETSIAAERSADLTTGSTCSRSSARRCAAEPDLPLLADHSKGVAVHGKDISASRHRPSTC